MSVNVHSTSDERFHFAKNARILATYSPMLLSMPPASTHAGVNITQKTLLMESPRMSRLWTVGLTVAVLTTLSFAAPPANAGETRNVWIVWEPTQIPGTLVFLDWAVAQNTPGTLGCVQPVRVTVKATGDDIPLLGAAVGSTACTATNTPCLPYTQVPEAFGCTPSPIFGVGAFIINNPATAGVTTATFTPGCLKPFTIYVDLDGNGVHDIKRGPQYGFAKCD